MANYNIESAGAARVGLAVITSDLGNLPEEDPHCLRLLHPPQRSDQQYCLRGLTRVLNVEGGGEQEQQNTRRVDRRQCCPLGIPTR